MNRGDVVKAELPRPKGRQSHEQFGYRRAVVLQDMAKYGLSTVVVIPTTSNLHVAPLGESFVVKKSTENGLNCDSTLLVHQIRALDTRRIGQVVGRLAEDDLNRLDAAVRKLLAL